MRTTNISKVQDVVGLSAEWVTNAQIRDRTGVEPHQQVFQITQGLSRQGAIERRWDGRQWLFRVVDAREGLDPPDGDRAAPGRVTTAGAFEVMARRVMSSVCSAPLAPGRAPGVPKTFDLVSAYRRVVGDAKYYTMVKGVGRPSAKLSVISEYVWLLEHVDADAKFLVFGNDRRVPELWLAEYGSLLGGIAFYYLSDAGDLAVLRPAPSRRQAPEV